MTSIEQLEKWMSGDEDEHVEFKQAKSQFDGDKLIDYCVALANEGGGVLVLGVTDKKPRKVVGTQAFQNISSTKHFVYQKLSMRVEFDEIQHPNGRVLVVRVPSRPVATPLQHNGRFLMRAGESLVSMTPDMIRRIVLEAEVDYSNETCAGATLGDLDEVAVERFRAAWGRKSANPRISGLKLEHLLSDAGLMRNGALLNAALILLGTDAALKRLLPQAEIIFEWRENEADVPYQDRREFRRGFFAIDDELWEAINARNTVQQLQEGFFRVDIRTFNEKAIREAILNAIAHRDYRSASSIFVRQSGATLTVSSPGGFPSGVTPDNVLFTQVPRNRAIAEALQLAGAVERSGQGVDVMYEETIREGKAPPDFTRSDEFHVEVTLRGTVESVELLRFLERTSQEGGYSFSPADLLVLSSIERGEKVQPGFGDRVDRLLDVGVIERVGRGRAQRFILSRKFYEFAGRRGVYTRRRGLDRGTNKELLFRHIKANAKEGSVFSDLAEVLPALTRDSIKTMLRELKNDGRVRSEGRTRGGRWFPVD